MAQVETIQCELWLLQWAETSNGGAKVVFQLHAEDLEHFKGLTLAKKGVAGQRFMAALVLLGDDEQPMALPTKLGPLGLLAVRLCGDDAFHAFLADEFQSLWESNAAAPAEERAKGVICDLCGITTRKELDTNADAAKIFHDVIRKPFVHRGGGGSDA